MSRPRSTRTAACWASSRSRRHRPGYARVARLAGRLRSGRSGRGGRHRRVRRRPGPSSARPGSRGDRGRSSRTARSVAATASPTSSTRSKRPGRRCRVGRRGSRRSADGDVEAIRALLVARRSGRNVRIKYLNQIRHLGFTAPDELRERLRDVHRDQSGAHRGRVAAHGRAATPSCTRRNSRSATLGRRVLALEADAERLDRRTRRHSCGAPRRACSRSTASGSTPPRSCWSPPATTRTG